VKNPETSVTDAKCQHIGHIHAAAIVIAARLSRMKYGTALPTRQPAGRDLHVYDLGRIVCVSTVMPPPGRSSRIRMRVLLQIHPQDP